MESGSASPLPVCAYVRIIGHRTVRQIRGLARTLGDLANLASRQLQPYLNGSAPEEIVFSASETSPPLPTTTRIPQTTPNKPLIILIHGGPMTPASDTSGSQTPNSGLQSPGPNTPHSAKKFNSAVHALMAANRLRNRTPGSPGSPASFQLRHIGDEHDHEHDHDHHDDSCQTKKGSVGIVFVEGVGNSRVGVLTVVEGAPAARDGRIKTGDLLCEIDGHLVESGENCLRDIRRLVLGDPGSIIKMKFERPSTGVIFDVELERKAVNSGSSEINSKTLQMTEDRLKSEIASRDSIISSMQNQIILEKKEIDHLQEANTILQQENTNVGNMLKDNLDTLFHAICNLRSQATQREAVLTELEKEVAKYQEKEEVSLKPQLADASNLRVRCAELDAALHAARQQFMETQSRHKEEIDSLRNQHILEMSSQQKKLTAEHAASMRAMEKNLNAAHSERKTVLSDLAIVNAELQQVKDHCKALSQTLERERDEASARWKQAGEEMEALKEQKEEEASILRSCLEEAEVASQRFIDQIEQLKLDHETQIAQLQKNMDESVARTRKTSEEQLRHSEAAFKVEIEQLKTSLERSRDEIEKMKREKETAATSLKQYKAEVEAASRKAKEEAQRLARDKSDAEAEIERLKQDVVDAKQFLDRRMAEMQEQLEVARQKQQALSDSHSAEIAALQNQHAETVKTLQVTRLHADETVSVEIGHLREALERSQEETERVRKDKEATAAAFREYRAETEAAAKRSKEEAQRLAKDKAEAEAEVERMKEVIAETQRMMESRLAELKQRNEAALEDARNMRRELVETQEREMAALRAEHADTVRSLQAMREQSDEAARQAMASVATASAAKAAAESSLRSKEQQLSEVERAMQQCQEEIIELQTRLRSTEAAAKQAAFEYSQRIESLNKMIQKTETETNDALRQSDSTMASLESQIEALEDAHRAELSSLRAEHSAAMASLAAIREHADDAAQLEMERLQTLIERAKEETERVRKDKEATAAAFREYRAETEAAAKRSKEEAQRLAKDKAEAEAETERTREVIAETQRMMETKIVELKQRNEAALEDARNMRRELVETQEREMAALRAEHADTVRSLQAMREQSDEAAQSELQHCQNALARCKEDLDKARKEKDAISTTLRDARSEIDNVIRKSKDDAAKLLKEKGDVEAELERTRNLVSEARQNLEIKTMEWKQRNDAIQEDAQVERRELLEAFDREKAAMRAEHSAELAAASASKANAEAQFRLEIDRLNASVERAKEEIERVKKDREVVSVSFREYRAETEASARRAKDEAQRLIKDKIDAEAETERVRGQVSEAHQLMEVKLAEMRILQEQALEDLRKERRELIETQEREMASLRGEQMAALSSLAALRDESEEGGRVEMARLQSVAERAKEETERVRKDKEATAAAFREYRAETEAAAKRSKEEAQRLAKDKADAEAEVERMKEVIAETQRMMESRLAELKQRNEAALEDARNMRRELVETQEREMAALRAEHADTVRSLQAMREQSDEAARQAMASVATASAAKAAAESSLRSKEQQLAESDRTITQLHEEISTLTTRLRAAETDSKQLAQEHIAQQEALKRLAEKAEEEVVRAQEDYATCCTQFETKIAQIEEVHRMEVATLQAEHCSALNSLAAMRENADDAAQLEMERLQTLIERGKEETERVRKDKEATAAAFREYRAETEAAAKRSKEEAQRLAKDKAEAEADVQRMKENVAEKERKLESRLAELKQRNEAALEDARNMRRELVETQEREMAALRAEHADTVRSLQAMREQSDEAARQAMASVATSSAGKVQVESSLRSKEQRIEDLEKALKQAQTDSLELQEKLKAADLAAKRSEMEYAARQETLNKTIKNANDEIAELTRERDLLRSNLSHKDANDRATEEILQSEIRRTKAGESQLRELYSAAQQTIEKLQEERLRITDAINALRVRYDPLGVLLVEGRRENASSSLSPLPSYRNSDDEDVKDTSLVASPIKSSPRYNKIGAMSPSSSAAGIEPPSPHKIQPALVEIDQALIDLATTIAALRARDDEEIARLRKEKANSVTLLHEAEVSKDLVLREAADRADFVQRQLERTQSQLQDQLERAEAQKQEAFAEAASLRFQMDAMRRVALAEREQELDLLRSETERQVLRQSEEMRREMEARAAAMAADQFDRALDQVRNESLEVAREQSLLVSQLKSENSQLRLQFERFRREVDASSDATVEQLQNLAAMTEARHNKEKAEAMAAFRRFQLDVEDVHASLAKENGRLRRELSEATESLRGLDIALQEVSQTAQLEITSLKKDRTTSLLAVRALEEELTSAQMKRIHTADENAKLLDSLRILSRAGANSEETVRRFAERNALMQRQLVQVTAQLDQSRETTERTVAKTAEELSRAFAAKSEAQLELSRMIDATARKQLKLLEPFSTPEKLRNSSSGSVISDAFSTPSSSSKKRWLPVGSAGRLTQGYVQTPPQHQKEVTFSPSKML